MWPRLPHNMETQQTGFQGRKKSQKREPVLLPLKVTQFLSHHILFSEGVRVLPRYSREGKHSNCKWGSGRIKEEQVGLEIWLWLFLKIITATAIIQLTYLILFKISIVI